MSKLYIISAPSGCGKTTIYNKLKLEFPHIIKTISDTTRSQRKGEVDGIDYNFIPTSAFEKKINLNKYAEYTIYDQDYYGTLYEEINEKLSTHNKVFMIIEVTGAMNVKKFYPDSVLIFILPPTMEELRRRLQQRGDNSPEEIERRLKVAKMEMEEKDKFDYIVVNDSVDNTTDTIAYITKLKEE